MPIRFFLLFLCSSYIAYAQSAEVFYCDTIDIRNNSPIALLFSLPRPAFNTNMNTGSSSFKTEFELTNYFSTTDKSNDRFKIDGETWRLRNRLSHQLNDQYQLHLSTSFIKHTGGGSDSFIYDFHEILELPQNGRIGDEHDLLIWELDINGQRAITFEEETQSWGDTEITIAWKPEYSKDLQINASLKLPTGNYAKQSGSEKFDSYISIVKQNPNWLKNRSLLQNIPLSLWYGAGLGYVGEIGALTGLSQNPVVYSFNSGIAIQLMESWQVKAQLDSHSPLFNTELRELGWMPIQFSFESAHQISQDIVFKAIISEDMRPRTVPDVIFNTGLTVIF